MSVWDVFSTRQKQSRGEIPDVFKYDDLPHALRVQIVHILNDAVGDDSVHYDSRDYCFTFIKDTILREHALFKLVSYPNSTRKDVFDYFLSLDSVELALDIVELAFVAVTIAWDNDQFRMRSQAKLKAQDAIEELNLRFKQHGVGYQFESRKIIRTDSELIHSEVIRPTLQLLRGKNLKGANEEFLRAHEHYRHARYQEAMVDALKAFESTLISICTIKGWIFQPKDSAKRLLDLVFEKGLLPAFMQSEFSALRGLLEGGVPVVRNKLGGHGQGVDSVEIPGYWARYAINTTASNILLLVEASRVNEKG